MVILSNGKNAQVQIPSQRKFLASPAACVGQSASPGVDTEGYNRTDNEMGSA